MKIICVDALKLEYLRHMPYLSSLTKKYQYGSLETPLGFWSGTEMFFTGKADTLAFFYHSKNSSLKWTKYLWFLGRFPLNMLINLQRFLKGEELFSLHKIPLRKLHYFDTAVKKPWHSGLNVDYEHIGILDKISHKHGTKSRETIKCLEKIDRMLSKKHFDLFFSDHGMMDVKEIITVPKTKVCFIDSPMARYWYDKPKLSLDKGRIIKADKKFGDTLFLVKPGILILPNYWQGNKRIKAMHGYDPKHEDMKGFYLIKKKGKRKDLTMEELHKKWKSY